MESLDLPRLRPDLKLLAMEEGLLIYDPARREIFDLEAGDLAVLRLLDGQRTPREVARQMRRPLEEILDLVDDLADEMLLFDPAQEEYLASCRAKHEAEDILLQPALDGRPAEEAAGRPIHVVDDARHTCRRCGACCHYAVPISPAERRRLERHPWPAELGAPFETHPDLQWGGLEETTATRSDPTRCVFLDAQNLCRVHGALGPAAKPFPCRLFPLAFPVCTPDRLIFSLTFECPWLWQSYEEGERLVGRQAELAGLAAEMEEVYALPSAVPLDGARTLKVEAYLDWERGLWKSPAAPATAPAWFLEGVQARWEEIVPGSRNIVPPLEELAILARTLERAVGENAEVLIDSPEGEEGSSWAAYVLGDVAARPEAAWADVRWEDAADADRFLGRFVRHFIEGKQALFYPNLWAGLRALAVTLLLARRDALLLARAAGQGLVSPAMLNRALARWCRLLDMRPLRLAFLGRQTTRTPEIR